MRSSGDSKNSSPPITKSLPFVADDGSLTYHGITLYGAVDMGLAYQTHGAPLSNSAGFGLSPARIAISPLHHPRVAPTEAWRARRLRALKLTTHSDALNPCFGVFFISTFLPIIEMARPVAHQPGGFE